MVSERQWCVEVLVALELEMGRISKSIQIFFLACGSRTHSNLIGNKIISSLNISSEY